MTSDAAPEEDVANRAAVSAHFSVCQFGPQPVVSTAGETTTTASQDTAYKISSFYLDSAGKVQVSLPLQLIFASPEALQEVLASGCIQPPPEGEQPTNDAEKTHPMVEYNFSIEARVKMTFGSGEAISATVEGVDIESTRVNDKNKNVLDLAVKAHVRVARQQGDVVTSVAGVKLNLEVGAVLTETTKTAVSSDKKGGSLTLERQALASGLRGLYFGRYQPTASSTNTATTTSGSSGVSSPDPKAAAALSQTTTTLTNAQNVVTQTRLAPPLLFQVSLDHAVTVEARSMNGPSMGETWIALNICHSNVHNHPVTITNVTLHPAFSKPQQAQSQSNSSSSSLQETVLDMSQSVKWRFLEGCSGDVNDDPNDKDRYFPKTLRPNEAYSIVLYLLAQDHVMSRTFASPISVTATLEDTEDDEGTEIVSIVQGEWTSVKRADASLPDSFRVDFGLPEAVQVGKMFSLSLNVHNLDPERKCLKVGVQSLASSGSQTTEESGCLFQNPSMEELLGNNRGENSGALLAVDDSAHLGTVEGHGSQSAKLRFIPLRAGTWPLPEFVLLLAETGGESKEAEDVPAYRCPHNLQIVASS